MKLIKLSKELLENKIEKFLEIEHHYSSNKNELWKKENFLFDLPKKWNYSFVAFDEEILAGYLISSLKINSDKNNYCYLHRNLIVPQNRNSSLLMRLTLKSLHAVKEDGLDLVKWKCGKHNFQVYNFHKKFADKLIKIEEINGLEYGLFEKII